jgi:hypothetical protein
LLFVQPAHAWNALGHKVIADIAWQRLDPNTRQAIAATLRRHPRFDDDFAKEMPADVDEDRWIFQQAAVWPDLARGLRGDDRSTYDHPTWHYVNFPLFVGGERPLMGVNLSTDYPPLESQEKWNVAQAVKFCAETLNDDGSAADKALAYCWLLHLVGDLHQPMHSTALFSDRFPTGDRGGNSIPLARGDNLHSLWDNLLGRSHKPNDVKRAVAKLGGEKSLRQVEVDGKIEDWIVESHEFAKSFAYSPAIIEAVQADGELQQINLPDEYLEEAGRSARRRIVAAGLRAGVLIGSLKAPTAPQGKAAPPQSQSAAELAFGMSEPPVDKSPTPTRPVDKTHWLNLSGNVRHNASCRWFQNTKHGRPCTANEGKPCGQCGG